LGCCPAVRFANTTWFCSFPCPIFCCCYLIPRPSFYGLDKTHTSHLLSHTSIATNLRHGCNFSLICYHYFHLFIRILLYSISVPSLAEYNTTTYIPTFFHVETRRPEVRSAANSLSSFLSWCSSTAHKIPDLQVKTGQTWVLRLCHDSTTST
jgi:hypothetical protein